MRCMFRAVALVSLLAGVACDETTTIHNTVVEGGEVAVAVLPPGALAPATVLVLSDRSTLLNLSTGEIPQVLWQTVLGGFTAGGELMASIDYRPADGRLYGVSNQARLYTIDPATGTCTVVSVVPFAALAGTSIAMDFDPVQDVVRIITNADENLRVNPDTGTLVATDTPVTPSGNVYAIAHTNSFAGAVSTSLFAIDQASGSLYRLDDPPTGVMTLVGATSVSPTQRGGFDISAGNIPLLAQSTGGNPALWRINLFSGALTGIFNIPTTWPILAMAIIPG